MSTESCKARLEATTKAALGPHSTDLAAALTVIEAAKQVLPDVLYGRERDLVAALDAFEALP